MQSLSSHEQRLSRLSGKFPLKSNCLKEREYFDSGDYAVTKTGKASLVNTESDGTQPPPLEKTPSLSFQ